MIRRIAAAVFAAIVYASTLMPALAIGTQWVDPANTPAVPFLMGCLDTNNHWVPATAAGQCLGSGGGGGGAVTLVSGAVASGAYSAGAFAAGAVVAGAFVDGWDVTQGTKGDGAYTGSGSASVVALLKGIYVAAGNAVPLNVNGSPLGQTGLTPGTAQTGTIVAANTDETSWAGTKLGAPSAYGTAPSGVVPGFNGFITNFPTTQTVSGTTTGNQGTPNTASNAWPVYQAASATGGATYNGVVAAASNNSTNVKASAGSVFDIQTSNINTATPYYLKLYDKATAPTCGTDTPVWRGVIPPNFSGNNASFVVGKAFTSGIGYCITAGIADTDNTSVPAATVLVNLDWK